MAASFSHVRELVDDSFPALGRPFEPRNRAFCGKIVRRLEFGARRAFGAHRAFVARRFTAARGDG
jgi:hypothetical protein